MAAVETELSGAHAQHEEWKKLNEGVENIALGAESEANQDIASGADKVHSDAGDDGQRILELLELFFSTPEFTDGVRVFIEENEASFVVVEEGEEQPLSNYDLYLKYTKLIEDQLEAFLKQHGIDHEDIAKLCLAEKEGGNKVSFSLDYIIASTQYDKFLQMMVDFKSLREFEIEEDDLFGWGLGEEGGEEGAEVPAPDPA